MKKLALYTVIPGLMATLSGASFAGIDSIPASQTHTLTPVKANQANSNTAWYDYKKQQQLKPANTGLPEWISTLKQHRKDNNILPVQYTQSLPAQDLPINDALMQVTDFQLHNCINNTALQNNYTMVSQLTSLMCYANGIYSLNGLEQFTGLTMIDLSQNMLADITPVSTLPNLTDVIMMGNQITDLTPLSSLSGLQVAIFSQNPVTDLTPLTSISGLRDIGLPDAGLTDLNVLATLTSLEFIDAGTNPLTDISAIAQHGALKGLGLEWTGLKNLAPLLEQPHTWEWLGVPPDSYCWQLDFIGQNHTFTYPPFNRPPMCDSSEDWNDYDGDGLMNMDEIYSNGEFNPVLIDTDGDGVNDGQLPGGDTYIHDALMMIADPGLYNCINNLIMTNNYMLASELTTLSCPGQGIYSITGLEAFIGLTYLELSGNMIGDISSLATLQQLEELQLWGNTISDIGSLTGKATIKRLYLGDNPIGDITPIQSLTNLTEIALPSNGFTDLSMLAGLTQLTMIDAGMNPVTDISALAQFSNLKALGLGMTQVQDLAPILYTTQTWEWLDVPGNTFCWQLEYIEQNHTFTYPPFYRPYCDSSQDWMDYDGDGLPNMDEIYGGEFNPVLFDTDGDGVQDGMFPGGDSYIHDALAFITDYQLHTCINEQIMTNNYVMASELKTLDCMSRSISSLEGLERFVGLQTLNFSMNMISDLTPITGLTTLKELHLYSNHGITDLAPIGNLTAMEILILGDLPVTDLSPINSMIHLRELALPDVGLTDLNFVAAFTALEFLDAGNNPVMDISGLSGLTALKGLGLEFIPLRDFAALMTQSRTWEWLGLPHNGQCWQYEYIEKNNTFLHSPWYKPACDSINDWEDYDGDGLPNMDEVYSMEFNPVLIDTDGDGVNDGQLPGGDSYIHDALMALTDMNLHNCINNEVMMNMYEFASQVTTINCHMQNITSLGGLDKFIALEHLDIGMNQVADLTPLSGLTTLKNLIIYDNQVADLTPITGLTNLEVLILVGNPIMDVSLITGFTGLKDIALPNVGLTDLSLLNNMPNLVFVDGGQNPITDLSALADKAGLMGLGMDMTAIQDIGPVIQITSHWDWLGLPTTVYCWQLDYVEQNHTFEHGPWYRPPTCDAATDYMDYDNDGVLNRDELMMGTNPFN